MVIDCLFFSLFFFLFLEIRHLAWDCVFLPHPTNNEDEAFSNTSLPLSVRLSVCLQVVGIMSDSRLHFLLCFWTRKVTYSQTSLVFPAFLVLWKSLSHIVNTRPECEHIYCRVVLVIIHHYFSLEKFVQFLFCFKWQPKLLYMLCRCVTLSFKLNLFV